MIFWEDKNIEKDIEREMDVMFRKPSNNDRSSIVHWVYQRRFPPHLQTKTQVCWRIVNSLHNIARIIILRIVWQNNLVGYLDMDNDRDLG